jgi:hypothetical protein
VSKRRHANRRPVEDYATDRVEFEKLNERLLTGLASLPKGVTTALLTLLSGGHDRSIDAVLLEHDQQHGPDAEQPALGLFGTGVLVDDLRELAQRIDCVQNPETADLDRLIRHIEWLNLHPPQESSYGGFLVRCHPHGWVIDTDTALVFGGKPIRTCKRCPCPLPERKTGRPAKFCSTYCRVEAHRARARGEGERVTAIADRLIGRSRHVRAKSARSGGKAATADKSQSRPTQRGSSAQVGTGVTADNQHLSAVTP